MATKGKKAPLTALRSQSPRPRAGRNAPRRAANGSWHAWRPYLPTLLLGLLAVVTLGVAVIMYYIATGSAFFQAREIVITGNKRAGAEEIRAAVQRQTAAGVWHADLEAVRAEVKKLAWVQEATVARVLPDGLRIQITEREKVAIVLAANNKLMWVDKDGVRLGPYSNTDKVANLLIIRGLDESETPAAQAANAQRLRIYQEIVAQWNTKGLTKYVSDVDLSRLSDVRVTLKSQPQATTMLGDRNWGERLEAAINAAAQERQPVESLDAKLDGGNVIVAAPMTPGKTPTSGNRTQPVNNKK